MPPIGFALGVFVALRYPRGTSKHGAWIVLLSLVAAVIWILIISSGALTATNGSY